MQSSFLFKKGHTIETCSKFRFFSVALAIIETPGFADSINWIVVESPNEILP